MNIPYSPDADRVEYEAVAQGEYYRVVVRGLASATAFSNHGRSREKAVDAVDAGTFESKDLLKHVTYDVANLIADNTTVEGLRDLGRGHGVSYARGSTKREMIDQLIEQEPALARRIAGGAE